MLSIVPTPNYRSHIEDMMQCIDVKKFSRAIWIRNVLIQDYKEDVEEGVLKELTKILKTTYGGNLDRLQADMAKMALLDLKNLDELDLPRRFIYALWKECDTSFSFSKEHVFKEIEKLWIHNLG